MTLTRTFGLLLGWLALLSPVLAQDGAGDDFIWENGLRQTHFGDRPIHDGAGVIELEAPYRAENAAIVPLRVKAGFPQTEDRYIRTVTLLIDNNPTPLAGRFHFYPASGRADLALRVRINAYTNVRAIAETNDGRLYMAKDYVKASGGCSAPVGTDIEAAMARLGQMRFRVRDPSPGEPIQAQLNISHPNITGLQMDQLTRLYLPAHFVRRIEVTYDGEPVLTAETDISISEDPSFRFYFVPQGEGELRAVVLDNQNGRFTDTVQLGAASS
ncbi:MAG: quinoprotein dehydrogenase-associated SoxYZ-like carrier [Candidatus Competibacterales bacterium]|nr:quinoprotein dehydrogenase-associated SoxYZ-like carrier [Candidatus Competibacterales bacterium]